MQHSHQCGLTAAGMLEGYGCGTIWTHDTVTDWKLSDHYCPKCGCGPFTFQLEKSHVSHDVDHGNNDMPANQLRGLGRLWKPAELTQHTLHTGVAIRHTGR